MVGAVRDTEKSTDKIWEYLYSLAPTTNLSLARLLCASHRVMAWSSAVNQPGPHDSAVKVPFAVEHRLVHTNYVNTISLVVAFRNVSPQIPVNVRNPN